MESMNIQAYKDGNDIILVFKNADTSLENIIMSMLSNITVKSVPALTDPVAEPISKPENLESCESIMPEFLSDNYEETEDVAEEATVEEKEEEVKTAENVVENDPTEVNNLVEYITLYSRIKCGLVKNAATCTDLLWKFKKSEENHFGKTMGSDLDKASVETIWRAINQFAPDIINKKTNGVPLEEYLKKSTVKNLMYNIRPVIWFDMKL